MTVKTDKDSCQVVTVRTVARMELEPWQVICGDSFGKLKLQPSD